MSRPPFVATESHFQTDLGGRESENRCLPDLSRTLHGLSRGERVKSSLSRCQTVCIMHNVRTRNQRGVEIRRVGMSYKYKAFCHKLILSP